MTPTPEQLTIIEAAVSTTDNLLISALAGAAKTTTLELICKALPPSPILSVCFNKRIAEAMAKRLPSNVLCQTLNAVGHRVWAAACAKRLTVDSKKSYTMLKAHLDTLSRSDRSDAYETFSDILKMISAAKLAGYIPEGKFPDARRLVTQEAFYGNLEEEPSELEVSIVETVLLESIRSAYNGFIDFDDQIYMPTLFGGTFPRFPLVLVDEAQDLSSINHEMLKKLVVTRLIAVGDPWQSIYGFRGAVASGMARLRDTFGMRELGLSVSFRCPIEVVKNARFRAPHMQWPDWAKPGTVRHLAELSLADIAPESAIICRNNAPLFSAAMQLLRAGRGVTLVGADIGPGLIRILKKLGEPSMPAEQLELAIDAWEKETLRKSRKEAATRDKADCLRVFARAGNTLGEAISYAQHLFASAGPIQLLSGHKSKGLEWDTVYHLDPWRIPSTYAKTDEEKEQELNVRYVIETRSKDSLFLVNAEDLY